MSILLENIGKSFGEKKVLDHFSYSFPDTGRYCIFGPSGCGKTTLLRIIAGFTGPDEGKVTVKGDTRFSFHFQENRLLPWYTVKQNLKLVTDEKRIPGYLEMTGLADTIDQYPDELSGGMKRRISMLRALVAESGILLLDEPLRELDEETSHQMAGLIRTYSENRLMIMVTHDLRQADETGCELIRLPAL